ncbi:uncharacterized protein EURHEDRAFT_537109 [Aspergillus ruber CBS 135680]|uniref:Uncharacterized protein n=1 Tax=Aspergillus ruber (strain CBS 135680) TaxID=1388766 RepID=A0A017SFE4_ASPRC|nr:uncharacterized protein EURHEDRAFT_537109 [Aspergillus ruber CBS 135680]EYE95364.1 hypothetical protein EURHEDRAFT_537109 [Aspergillus ruber CBS 135680]
MSRCRLGHGSYSTTWLARDEQLERYVAVKSCIEDSNLRETGIISALNGSYRPGAAMIRSMLDKFSIQDPNGNHDCYVSLPAREVSV